jgi:hypothetical protein
MALTITNTTASSLSLIPADNPVTLTGTNSFTNNATVSVSGTPAVTTGFGSYFGLYGSAGGNWTITNLGTLRASGTTVVANGGSAQTGLRNAAIGIGGMGGTATATGTIINEGLISAANRGVIMYGLGVIDNRAGATIASTLAIGMVGQSETLLNAGTVSGSIVVAGNFNDPATLMTTGVVTNSGQIAGSLTLNRRVLGTVTNTGTMTAASGSAIVVSGTSTLDLNNQASGVIQGNAGVSVSGSTAASTITNSGRIIGTSGAGLSLASGPNDRVTNATGGTISGTSAGVSLASIGAIITNQSGGSISGGVGILVSGSASSLSNFGQVSGSTAGVNLSGAAIAATNNASGIILGSTTGINVSGSAVALVNVGQVTGTTTGVRITGADASFTNQGTVSGTTGVYFGTGVTGTLLNTGTINATNTAAGYAVRFAKTSNLNRLITNAYGTLGGKLSLGSGVLELTTNTASTIGTIAGFGGMITNVGSVLIGGGAAWRLAGSSSGFTNVGIVGFDTDDSITLTDFVAVSETFDGSSLVLTDASSAQTTLTLSGTFAPSAVILNTTGGVTTITIACFAEGTLIRTDAGDVAVQDLRPGDAVALAAGGTRPIRWIGQRTLDLTRHPDPRLVRPIRIAAGAFADGVPARDLRVSPDHALFVDGFLVPARLLVNGGTIIQDTDCPSITYFHLQLDDHDILLAEGLAAESYLDTGNSGLFANAGEPLILHPDLSGQAGRLARSCAPFADSPALVKPLWDRLASRAEGLGRRWDFAVTREPDVRIEAAGTVLRPIEAIGDRYRFVLPEGCDSVRLLSRASAPADLHPWLEDRRRLGLSVRRIVLRANDTLTDIALDDPALTFGWWDVERHGATLARWTDGDALLPLGAGGGRLLEITAGCQDAYPADRPAEDVGPFGMVPGADDVRPRAAGGSRA